MAEIIVLRGNENSGKTTTCSVVYEELNKQAKQPHIFNYNQVSIFKLQYQKDGSIEDFSAVLIVIGSIKIGIISAGDEASLLKDKLNKLLEEKPDIIICCARTKNMKGSSIRMLLENFATTHKLTNVYIKPYKGNGFDSESIKKENKDTVMKIITQKMKLIQENNK